MPFIDVKIYDRRLDEESERALIERLTQATVDVFGEDIREQTWITLTPAATPLGLGGVPGR
ncbi:hypothetical protein GLX30_34400 [Streptomyces sp. Tu 2975]|uniref:tautomerase family protein n=1 Tax=Streptomyces sp. Tu 2975 TaxID=2676871 RepID=UPI00135A0F3C|nr:tautomerase family protein [Streptomyces sp. Tu 2975]QIP88257.1 hypothetical protein GLX30_34400 [Streptomyces sp. Tu 2975]